ncbi:hypothetical protein LTR33_004039, partial [Friedmanniomyces endolithicus]
SGHVQILRDHGRGISAPTAMINVYAELAKPDTTGGVVVLLERPSHAEEIRYGGGYHTVLSKTKTLKEVARLISLVTDGVLTIEDVTILDAFPLQPDDDPALHFTKSSSKLLNKLLATKRPDIVLSCFRVGDHEGLIRFLQHPGVGDESNNQHVPVTVWPHHISKKVDAFHPSFAFTYHADDDCFSQLLELQFAKAFGEWYGTWQEASWMDGLRGKARACKSLATGTTVRERNRRGTMVSMPAQPSIESGIQDIASRMTTMNLSDAQPASRAARILVGTGGRALWVSQRILVSSAAIAQ